MAFNEVQPMSGELQEYLHKVRKICRAYAQKRKYYLVNTDPGLIARDQVSFATDLLNAWLNYVETMGFCENVLYAAELAGQIRDEFGLLKL